MYTPKIVLVHIDFVKSEENQSDVYPRYMALRITYPPPENVKGEQMVQLGCLH